MKPPANTGTHQYCPRDWRNTPNLTGSYELDAVIARNANGNLPARMRMYADMSGQQSYGPRTAYNGYSGLSGDD